MESGKHDKPDLTFTPDQIRRVLQTGEGKQLLQLLNRDGGAKLRQAAEAVQKGELEKARQLMEPMMRNPEAAELVGKISRGDRR